MTNGVWEGRGGEGRERGGEGRGGEGRGGEGRGGERREREGRGGEGRGELSLTHGCKRQLPQRRVNVKEEGASEIVTGKLSKVDLIKSDFIYNTAINCHNARNS